MTEKLIFEHSRPGRRALAQAPAEAPAIDDIPAALRRESGVGLPEASEMDVVRHYTRLSQLNFSIDTHFYPLGSCTMKHNPRACNTLASLPGFLNRHPLAPASHGQGMLACLYELQEMLTTVTGMDAVSLTPMAGAQGEFTGVAMIKAYHESRGDTARDEILVPDAAHGTNPASAIMAGMKVVVVGCDDHGNIDVADLKAHLLRERLDDIAENVVRRLLTYGLGRALSYRDRYSVEELVERSKDLDYALGDMIVSVCLSDPFRKIPTRIMTK